MNTAAETRVVQERDSLNDLAPECFETFEDVKEELEAVERELARRLKLRRPIRRTLIALDRANKLDEDELVARWHELYSSYADWARSDAWEEPPLANEADEPLASKRSEDRAAQAALAAFRDCLALSA